MREGLYRSVKMLIDNPRANAVKSVILLTDGAWNTGGNPQGGRRSTSFSSVGTGSVITWAKNNNGTIYTIALGSDSSQSELQAYANETGGKFYRENALALQAERRLSESDVAEESVECGQTMVSSAWLVSPIAFQVFEEPLQKLGVEFLKAQIRWCSTQPIRSEPQQQTKRVPIARHGVGTGALLGYQTVGEESLTLCAYDAETPPPW